MIRSFAAIVFLLLAMPAGAAAASKPAPIPPPAWLPGVNLAVGEFGKGLAYGKAYAYPTNAEVDYYAAKGLRLVRVPFKASRLFHPGADGLSFRQDIALIEKLVDHAAGKNVFVVLDMHDYGRSLTGKLIGREAGGSEEFAECWGKIAERLKDKGNVIFGLMNEPNKQSATEWLAGANLAIDAIRKAGAAQLVLVAGSYWDGAHSWVSSDNDTVMLGVVDPIENYAYEAHQYLDAHSSGDPSLPVVPAIGASAAQPFTEWLRANGKRGFIGEFAFTSEADFLAEGEALVRHISENRDVYLGFAYWAGGPWWGDYPFSLEPKALGKPDESDKPQMEILRRYVGDPPAQ
jgi:endoglucanase